ncbi:MAG: DNA-directed RNA polymerases II 24 kDa polypeptide (RNA polymerase II subunit 5) [Phylliscum demangeonii]|nr:MAG: DNA-directed RNA polymerases II 24 kDa polypeptide (RNA polymerase II subunit 5) [Phylliscum demangeonii]
MREMIYDRGYEISQEEREISPEEFRAKYTTQDGKADRRRMTFSTRPLPALISKVTPPASAAHPNPAPQVGTLWVEFVTETSVGVKTMRTFAQHLISHNFHTGILITAGGVTPAAVKVIPTVLPIVIETFVEQDLLVNITHHELVPKHVLLSFEEKAALLVRYRLRESQLPRIQIGDPVARYYGLRRTQVVKIIRRSETAGRYASYRWTV